MPLHLIVPTLVLIAGIINDLKSRKVRNYLVVLLLFTAIANVYFFAGWEGLKWGGLSLLVALGSCMPLVLTRIMGAGDMKLLMAFSVGVSPMSVFLVLIYSFVWGALLGVFQAILKGEGMSLINNTLTIMTGGKKAVSEEKLHKIPYTVALFFGWLTQLSLTGFSG
ncbi:MAG: prepilin peptidase [Bdellovibrionaceae bacterium]|nr:prepilin peptidase [Pseudobdellovibrionaceae bacterium]